MRARALLDVLRLQTDTETTDTVPVPLRRLLFSSQHLKAVACAARKERFVCVDEVGENKVCVLAGTFHEKIL